MRQALIGVATVVVLALPGFAAGAAGPGGAAWMKVRHTGFAAYRAAHPDPDAEIADLKARTAALVAARPPAPARSGDAVLQSPPVIWRMPGKPIELWDGPEYPRIIVLPAGEYTMGSSASEQGRLANEGPPHRVRIAASFAVSQYPVTMGEFARFAAETHHDMGEACFTMEHGEYKLRARRDYLHVGFPQTRNGPALCLNFADAQAYVAWLSKKTGHSYRLLSEAEYEYANRAGTVTAYWWGDDIGRGRTNCDGCGSRWDNRQLAPVGSFGPNPFGLYDTTGNTLSWLADCWTADYARSPADGSADMNGDCDLHDLRGGSLHSPPRALRSAARSRHWFSLRNITVGLRIARTL
jgi:formylglycine-generating enzyme required for sulfatase activity